MNTLHVKEYLHTFRFGIYFIRPHTFIYNVILTLICVIHIKSKSQFMFIFARIRTTILSFCFYFYHKYRYLL